MQDEHGGGTLAPAASVRWASEPWFLVLALSPLLGLSPPVIRAPSVAWPEAPEARGAAEPRRRGDAQNSLSQRECHSQGGRRQHRQHRQPSRRLTCSTYCSAVFMALVPANPTAAAGSGAPYMPSTHSVTLSKYLLGEWAAVPETPSSGLWLWDHRPHVSSEPHSSRPPNGVARPAGTGWRKPPTGSAGRGARGLVTRSQDAHSSGRPVHTHVAGKASQRRR